MLSEAKGPTKESTCCVGLGLGQRSGGRGPLEQRWLVLGA